MFKNLFEFINNMVDTYAIVRLGRRFDSLHFISNNKIVKKMVMADDAIISNGDIVKLENIIEFPKPYKDEIN